MEHTQKLEDKQEKGLQTKYYTLTDFFSKSNFQIFKILEFQN